MNGVVLKKQYEAPPVCVNEVLRYAGCKGADAELLELAEWGIKELENKLTYMVCYRLLPVEIKNGVCNFGVFSLSSRDLCKNLKSSKSAVVFAATLGTNIDRLISKYSSLSPSKALMLQAVGAERIEALCDMFCEDISQQLDCSFGPRFSPGYGDLSLDAQREIFGVLQCHKHIGLTLNDYLTMSPSKSVTAFIGVRNGDYKHVKNKCETCEKADCKYRGVI